MAQLHFCIHGAGGLGSVIGGYLAESGQRVTLIARQRHVDAIRARGLTIVGRRGEVVVRENLEAVTRPEDVQGEIDYYILLTKVKDSQTALADAACLVERTATALTLQNGIGKERFLIERFGADKVLGASIIEGGTLVEPGVAHNHVTVPTTAYFGELDGRVSERAEVIAEAFTDAHLGAKAVDCIEQVLWEKCVQVGGASAWSASTLVGNPRLGHWHGLAVPEGAMHYVTIARDALAVYKGLGYQPQNFFAPLSRLKEIDASTPEEAARLFREVALRERDREEKPVRTSMHNDVLNGRKTEVDVLLKPIVDKGAELGIDIPTFAGAYRVIKTLDEYLS